ncbi:hypothetical protein I4U23_022617 [Adineta vaga]|nr:hypothetical protein I4U23_022617 [Adineta vaga]
MSGKSEIIDNVLKFKRWIVVLGEPGCGKTTLVRWMTRVFAEAAHHSHEKVDLEGYCRLPVRIPILIRIGELAAWFAQHKTKSLMDYIGEHTWFSERYCHDESGNVLKELINHGHALILLDGLDEISEFGLRSKIVELVEEFIEKYVYSSDCISAFDDKMFDTDCSWDDRKVVEAQPPNIYGGNQIVVTSRTVGYQSHPLNGPFIEHYSLLLMNHKEANEFIKIWMKQVDKSVRYILLKEGIKLNEEKMKTSLKTQNYGEETVFENSTELLKANPSLLSLICTFIFQSSVELHLKSRVEIYNYAVQSALRAWKSTESSILESVVKNFLIDLAIYLHLNSPSGLIDAFDMKHLCCLALKLQKVSNDRTILNEYAEKLIYLLESNVAIVAERGLQVFGFLHLSFQEYFVAQGLVRGSSINEVAKRILSFTINSRFRESLLLAFSWISWKWPFDKYNRFCNLLFTPTENHSIPFGILLFFDAINDIHRLPAKSVIFIALNNLLNHPSNEMRETYLISNLSKLPEDIIIEWMHLHLKDEKCLLKFCQSFPLQLERSYDKNKTVRKPIPTIIYRQLWSSHHMSSSTELLIDQILRNLLISDDVSNQIFDNDFLSHNICVCNINPLILSIIIAVCGGIYFKSEKNMTKIDFSPKHMHRESSILAPIVEYFDNNEESHIIKVQKLIKKYESVLRNSSPSDTSVDITDTFIALICLQGLSYPLIYQYYAEYQALPLALKRLKRTWFYLKEHYKIDRYGGNGLRRSFMISEIESIKKIFFSQSDQSEELHIPFLIVFEAALKKLGMWNVVNSLIYDFSCNNKVGRYFQRHPEFIHFIANQNLDQTSQDIHSMEMLQKEPSFLVSFLPRSLQQLYYYTTISPVNKTDSLPFVVFLSQYLIHLKDINDYDLKTCFVLSLLQPLFKEYMLENYAFVLFWKKYYDVIEYFDKDDRTFFETMKDRNLLDSFFINQPKDWKALISVERQRICEAIAIVQNQKKDLQLFAASISLARLFQAQYSCQSMKNICHNSAESEEVHFAVTNIVNPVLRIIALSIIFDMNDPLIFDEEQRNKLQWEMISLLQSLLPRLSLLKGTLLFVRCHTVRHVFQLSFQYMAKIIGGKLNQTLIAKQNQGQEAAYIALQKLNNSDLSDHLSKFAKQKENLSDLLQFNSTIFYQYFIRATSFNSSNPIFLSSMYLTELIFDAQILNMYTITAQKTNIWLLTELRQLWNVSPNDEKIMTYKAALWITNYLHMSNKQKIHEIIEDMSSCSMIERKALSIIEKWLDYRTHKDLNFFAHYAALQLVAEGSNTPDLIRIIEEIFSVDSTSRLRHVVKRLFISQYADSTAVRQILITLHRNVRYSLNISVQIDCKETFKLILNLELERITSNVRQIPVISSRPFLLMIDGCTADLQLYLAEHLRTLTTKRIDIENSIKEEYVAVVVKWFIQSSIQYDRTKDFSIELYKYIFVLLHDQRFPRVQKAILNAFNSTFIKCQSEKNVFMQDDISTNLEKVICLWDTYSEDIVAICLIAYGNSLRMLQRFEINQNVSDEIKNVLTNLAKTSCSEIISIQANLCLIFSQYPKVRWHTISNWFKKESDMTSDKEYKTLLQLTLYPTNILPLFTSKAENEIVEYIKVYSAKFIDTFVTDLYHYLCNKNKGNYLAVPAPKYIDIAANLSETKSKEFCYAIRKSSFGEDKFKNELYIYFKNNPNNGYHLIELYIVFGTITIELLDMLEWVVDYQDKTFVLSYHHLKQVSDRDVIDKLFQLIDLTTSNKYLKYFLDVLERLAEIGAVSLLELHQRISLSNNVSYGDEYNRFNDSQYSMRWKEYSE